MGVQDGIPIFFRIAAWNYLFFLLAWSGINKIECDRVCWKSVRSGVSDSNEQGYIRKNSKIQSRVTGR